MQIVINLPEAHVEAILRRAKECGLSSDEVIQTMIQNSVAGEGPSPAALIQEVQEGLGNGGESREEQETLTAEAEPMSHFIGMLAGHNPYGDGLEYQEKMRSEWGH